MISVDGSPDLLNFKTTQLSSLCRPESSSLSAALASVCQWESAGKAAICRYSQEKLNRSPITKYTPAISSALRFVTAATSMISRVEESESNLTTQLARSLGTLLSVKRSAALRKTSLSSTGKNLSRFQASDFTLGAKYPIVLARSSFKFRYRRNHRVARDINLS